MPLVSDIAENICIKERRETSKKIVFMTLKKIFELTVMFVGLTNSPAMFQMIMNKILQDLINTREVVSFIYNVIVGIEEEDRK